MERRKLFSSVPQRRKLFSSNQSGVSVPQIKKVICQDCGYSMDTLEITSALYCPKCGGKRFNVVSSTVAPEGQKEFSRRSLFGESEQREFSQATNPLEEKLKYYSGKVLTNDQVEKYFSSTGMSSSDLVEKGFADVVGEDSIRVLDTAFMQSKLFSKLIISVTKELDLDPITCPKEDIIESLENKGSLSPRGIVLIKKAHSIPLVREASFSDNVMEEWAIDSGILNDIRLEFGGRNMSVSEFQEVLNSRYDDAPCEILPYLIEKGIVIPRDNEGRLDIRK